MALNGWQVSGIISLKKLMPENDLPVLAAHQIPLDEREIGIMSGYRPNDITARQSLAYLFNATNETFNFWTHFLPSVYFIYKLVEQFYEPDFIMDPLCWPFLVFLCMCSAYTFTSSSAHAFSSLSEYACHICYFLDYSAVSLYSCSVAVLYFNYSFNEEFRQSFFGRVYLEVAVFVSVSCTLLSCASRLPVVSVAIPNTQALRLASFGLVYIWVTTPLFWHISQCDEFMCDSASLYHHKAHIMFSMMAGLLYGAHLPERLAPGKFDIVGHSHQFLHIGAILTSFEQMQACSIELNNLRRISPISEDVFDRSLKCVCTVSFVFLINLAIIAYFILKITFEKMPKKPKNISIPTECSKSL